MSTSLGGGGVRPRRFSGLGRARAFYLGSGEGIEAFPRGLWEPRLLERLRFHRRRWRVDKIQLNGIKPKRAESQRGEQAGGA